MLNFFAGIVYMTTLATGFYIGYFHTIGDPLAAPVSGYVGLASMVILPQIGLAYAFWVVRR